MSAAVETENPPVEQSPATEDVPAADVQKPVEEKKRKERKPRENKPKAAKAPSHPPYFQMIKEAVLALNEKSGSSPQAIAKFIQEKHKNELPMNFRKMLTVQLRNSAAKGKLIKIKASYKLAEPAKKSKRLENNAKPAQKKETPVKRGRKPAGKKPKKSAVTQAKPKQPKSIKSPAAKKAKKAGA